MRFERGLSSIWQPCCLCWITKHGRGRVGPVGSTEIVIYRLIAAFKTELCRLGIRICVQFWVELAKKMRRLEGLGIAGGKMHQEAWLWCGEDKLKGLFVNDFDLDRLTTGQYIISGLLADVGIQ